MPADPILDTIAVNTAVDCLTCGHTLHGHVYWPLRKSMQLHRHYSCPKAKFSKGYIG